MDIKDRFFAAFDYLKSIGKILNYVELAPIIGENNKNGVSDIKGNRKELTTDHINKFVLYFPEISIAWIMLGTGSMIISYPEALPANIVVREPEPIINRMPKVVTVDRSGNDNIALVPVQAAAGYLNGFGDTTFIETLPTYSLPKLSNGTFRMFQVKGHSMFPTIHDGAYVVGQFVENWVKDVKDDRVYVIVSKEDGVIVKRCLNRIKKYGHIYAKSDNRKDYPNMTVDAQSVLEIWEYKMHLAFELANPADFYDRLNDLEAKVEFLQDKVKKQLA